LALMNVSASGDQAQGKRALDFVPTVSGWAFNPYRVIGYALGLDVVQPDRVALSRAAIAAEPRLSRLVLSH
jgi:hypothetical protein